MNGQAIAELIGARFMIEDETTLHPAVLSGLNRVMTILGEKIREHDQASRPGDLRRLKHDAGALMWALRVLTHPDTQTVMVDEVHEHYDDRRLPRFGEYADARRRQAQKETR